MSARFLAVAFVLAVGCAKPVAPQAPASRIVVVTQIPAGNAGADADPRIRYPDGSRVVLLDLARPAVPPRVITEGLIAAGGASVSVDGTRIAFVAKATAADRFAVWTCSADGSGRVTAFESAADCGSAAFLGDGRLVCSMAVPPGWALFVTDAAGGPPQRITFSGGDDVDPAPLRDGRIAYSSRATGAAEFASFSVHVDGTGVALFSGPCRDHAIAAEAGAPSDPAWRTVASVALAARRKPQGHLSVVDPSQNWGGVFCVDARPAGAAHADRVRLSAVDGRPRVLGDVPLQPDGSFYVRVPPDVPLALDLLDAAGKIVASQRAPFWVRPGETRGCVGCHDDQDTTPPNVRPLAVLGEPTSLVGVRSAEGSR